MTITVGIQHLTTGFADTVYYGKTMAAAAITALPAIAFFLIFQRQIISGIQVSSGIKQ